MFSLARAALMGVALITAPSFVAAQAPDTATVRLHISKMTCGSCPTTARLRGNGLGGYD